MTIKTYMVDPNYGNNPDSCNLATNYKFGGNQSNDSEKYAYDEHADSNNIYKRVVKQQDMIE